MSLDLKPVQVRLSEDAYDALRMIADANGQDLGITYLTCMNEVNR